MSAPPPASGGSPPSARPSSIWFALLAHPTVQGVRFLTKAALAWFLIAADFGEVMLAGLLVNLVGRLAVLGLDEAVVYAEHTGPSAWRRLRSLHHVLGAVGTCVAVGVGVGIGELVELPRFELLVVVLAPWIWIQNATALPAALLVRHQAFRALFWIDVAAISSFALTTLGAAALDAGVWSVALGWIAQGVVRCVLAHGLARPLVRASAAAGDDASETWRSTVRYGAHLAGAQTLGFVCERADAIGVGLALGRAATGLYDWALHLAFFGLQYLTSLAERVLFPRLARAHRRGRLRTSYLDVLRIAYLAVVPAHLMLAAVAPEIVRELFPPSWHDAAPLVSLFALAAASMCVELAGTTALKAAGESRCVARLAVVRLGLLAAALGATLAVGTTAVAASIATARVLSMLATEVCVRRRLGIRVARELHPARPALAGLVGWSIGIAAVHAALAGLADGPVLVGAELAAGIVLWVVAFGVLDRDSVRALRRRDWKALLGPEETEERRAA